MGFIRVFGRFIRKLIILLIVLIILAILATGGYFGIKGYILYKDTMNEQDLISRVTEVQYSKDFTELIYVSEDFVDAIVAAEDKTFYDHKGINPKSIARALYVDLKNRKYSSGGSTITQQVAKNLCFSRDKQLSRKAAELFVVKDLEKLYTKEEILELYINIIYYGDGFTGINQASMGYFGKKPDELNFTESTLLAGVPRSPSRYALGEHYDKAFERQQDVIKAMVKNGVLTWDQVQERIKRDDAEIAAQKLLEEQAAAEGAAE